MKLYTTCAYFPSDLAAMTQESHLKFKERYLPLTNSSLVQQNINIQFTLRSFNALKYLHHK